MILSESLKVDLLKVKLAAKKAMLEAGIHIIQSKAILD